MTADERLDRIEHQNFHLRVGLVLVLLAAVALMVMGQAAPGGTVDEVRARAFILVDANGKERAKWSTSTIEGMTLPSLAFAHDNGRLGMSLGPLASRCSTIRGRTVRSYVRGRPARAWNCSTATASSVRSCT